MPKVTLICFLSSLLSYGMGFTKMSVITELANTQDYNVDVSLATGYFVLAILFAVIGFVFFALRFIESKKVLISDDIELRGKVGRELNVRRHASLLEVNSN